MDTTKNKFRKVMEIRAGAGAKDSNIDLREGEDFLMEDEDLSDCCPTPPACPTPCPKSCCPPPCPKPCCPPPCPKPCCPPPCPKPCCPPQCPKPCCPPPCPKPCCPPPCPRPCCPPSCPPPCPKPCCPPPCSRPCCPRPCKICPPPCPKPCCPPPCPKPCCPPPCPKPCCPPPCLECPCPPPRDPNWTYANIDPELRKYVVIITPSGGSMTECEVPIVMDYFLTRFMEDDQAKCVEFVEIDPVKLFDCKMVVVPEDRRSSDWVITNICCFCSYLGCNLIDYFCLEPCSFVLPLVTDCLYEVFAAIENQNEGLCTCLWSICRRECIDKCDCRAVTDIVENQLITLYLDKTSRQLIECKCNIIKYCYWKLKVTFC